MSPILAEPVRLAGLPGVAVPIRPVLTLHERRVDRPAHPRHPRGRDRRSHRPEDHSRGDRHHPTLLSCLLHHGISQALGRDLVRGPGASSLAGPGRRDRLPVRLKQRVLVGQIAVGGDQVHQTAPGASLELVDHRHDILDRPLAGHDADHQPALGIDRDVVPGVSLAVIGRLGLVAILLLLGHERPLLIELGLAREGGKSRPTRRGGRGNARQRPDSGGRRCRDRPCRADPSVGRRTLRRYAPGPIRSSPAAVASRRVASLCARRSEPCKPGSGACVGPSPGHSDWSPRDFRPPVYRVQDTPIVVTRSVNLRSVAPGGLAVMMLS